MIETAPLNPTLSEWDEVRAAQAEYRSQWPDLFASVRDAIALGFWPECYGGGPAPHFLQPPTKFGYPRAGVHAPFHINGIGAGSELLVFSHQHGSPDELRMQPVWSICGHTIGMPTYRSFRLAPMPFDDALNITVTIGDYMRTHFIVPDFDPDTRVPTLQVEHWRELSMLAFSDEVNDTMTQLDMFSTPPEHRPGPLVEMRDAIRAALEQEVETGVIGNVVWASGARYWFDHLVEHANRLRLENAPVLEVIA